jgi:hypothetical protein
MANSYGPSDEETTLCAQLANLVCTLHGPLMPPSAPYLLPLKTHDTDVIPSAPSPLASRGLAGRWDPPPLMPPAAT